MDCGNCFFQILDPNKQREGGRSVLMYVSLLISCGEHARSPASIASVTAVLIAMLSATSLISYSESTLDDAVPASLWFPERNGGGLESGSGSPSERE